MSFFRKLLVGVVSLMVVLGIYLLYTGLNKTPPIDIDRRVGVADSNIDILPGKGGKIGDAQIRVLEGPVYQTRGPNKEIEREFGFAELVRTMGDVWEVDKPWMKIYQRQLEFSIKADKGTTELETVLGRSTPKDATFEGNVVIHIVPAAASAYKESTVYLDNLIFLSDKSQFSTPGPIEVVSEDIRMNGRGVQFVYNDRTERLEYLRLTHLDSLRIKSTEEAFLSKIRGRRVSKKDGQTESRTAAPIPQPPAQPPQDAQSKRAETPKPAGQADPNCYRCILSSNVVIDTPNHLVFAEQDVSINDILWYKVSAEQNRPPDANSTANVRTGDSKETASSSVDVAKPPAAPSPQPPAVQTGPGVKDAAPQEQAPALEPNLPGQTAAQTVEIIVTCDNGMLLVPMDSRRTLKDFPSDGLPSVQPKELDVAEGQTSFFTRRIDYSALTEDTIAHGASKLTFYSGDVMAADANATSVPVTVTSKDGAKFFKASNQAVFERDCLCTMPQQGLVQPRDVRFSGSKFTVNLPQAATAGPDAAPEIIAAGPVELTFWVEDSNAALTKEPPLPVKVTAQRHAKFLPDANQAIFDGNCLCTMPQEGLSPDRSFTLASSQLIANLPKKGVKTPSDVPDILALGPVKLDFYVDAFDSNEPNAVPLPAKVTATKHARFLPSKNQVLFEGDSKAVVVRQDPNYVEEYILSSQQIAVDLPADANSRASASSMGIEHLRAVGGIVTLATKKTSADLLLSGIELICRQFDYDPNQQLYSAVGPGIIKLANAEAPAKTDPNDKSPKFSLNKPCWAVIQNYDALRYFQAENRIIVDAGSAGALVVQYFPIKNGKFSDHIIVTANHVEANLIETSPGRTDLSTLTASGGVTYQAKDNEFIGGQLFYDHAKQLIKVIGSESFPCQFNGQLTDQIEYDLKTGKVKAELVGPGALRLK